MVHSAVSGWPKDTGTPETPSTRSSRLVKSRYVTRCCAPGIASPRYLYHSMRETRHSSFVRICIIGRGGILYAGQGTTSLPWPIYSSRRSSPYVRGDRSISRRNWSIDFFFSFFLLIFCDNRGKKRVEYYFYARQPISAFNYPNKMNVDFLNPEHRFPFRWNNVWAELFRN